MWQVQRLPGSPAQGLTHTGMRRSRVCAALPRCPEARPVDQCRLGRPLGHPVLLTAVRINVEFCAGCV